MSLKEDVRTRANIPMHRRVARAILPGRLRHELGTWWFERGMDRFPDRVYLKRGLLPAVASRGGKVLFVGCRRYTKRYPSIIEGLGSECWTIDVDPTTARWGAKGRHETAAIQEARRIWPAAMFDTIVLHGVFGYGLDSKEDQQAALRTCHDLLKPVGWLFLGWSTDRCADPLDMQFVQRHFRHLGWRKTFGDFPVMIDVFSRACRLAPQRTLSDRIAA